VLFSLFLIEIIADQQQWKYQTNKYKWIELSKQNKKTNYTQEEIESFKRGFCIEGLFKYSRHPNFFAEISIWWAFYAFTISSQYSAIVNNFNYAILFNYSLWATLSLTLLFQGSTNLTENITASKYPEYAKYKAKVSRFIPLFTTYQPKQQKNN
jgi:steroid 5-alpha reductase family enzyme